jgi:RNA polymerase sigma factor (sigma-70 family)
MPDNAPPGPAAAGLEAAFLEHRERLLRFLRARGAGESAEDLLQEVWLKIASARTGPVAAPLPYIYAVANRLMIDRHRSRRQEELREREWTATIADTTTGQSDVPGADRLLAARQMAALVAALLDGLEPPRVGQIFRRHRVDGIGQRQIAQEFGVSLSTVEADLRKAYAALAQFRERHDEA